MGSRSRPEVTETRIDPRLVPFVEQGLQGAQSLFQTGQIPGAYVPKFYQGPTYVGPSEFTEQAIQSAAQTAQQQSPLVQKAQQAAQSLTGFQSPGAGMFQNIYGAAQPQAAGMYRDIYGRAGEVAADQTAGGAYLGMNPFLQGTFAAAARPIEQRFQSQIQDIASQASRAGRFGSSAMGQLQAGAAESLASNLSGLGERLAFQGYQAERQFQEQALNRQQQAQQQALINQLAAAAGIGQGQYQGLSTQLQAAQGLTGAAQGAAGIQLQAANIAPALAEQDYAGAQKLLQAGQLQEQYQRQVLQDAINRYNFQQEAPYRALSQYSAFLSGFPQGAQQAAPSYTNPAASLLGGAALVSAFNQPQQAPSGP